MGLEAATYLDGLDAANPVVSDPRSEGDDHLRLIKAAAKATFPGLAGRAWRKQSKASGYTVVTTDNMTLIECTTALTLSLTAAATLGNGHMFLVRANGGAVIIDPAGTELINGAATITVPNGDIALVFCDGIQFVSRQLISLSGANTFSGANTVTGPFTTGGSGTILGIGTGARMVFQQTSAPTGWTKEVSATYNDAALRFQTGVVATGGADAFSTHFGTGKATAGHTLTQAETPLKSHSHGAGSLTGSVPSTDAGTSGLSDVALEGTGAPNSSIPITVAGSTATASDATASAHSHTLNNFDIKFADCIIATKD